MDDDDLQAYVPMDENVPSLFNLASPTAAVPVSTGRHSERLSDKVRRLRRQLSEDAAVAGDEPGPAAVPLPFNAFYDVVEVSSQQCGNPLCTVPSVNGKHSGNCLFPPPLPRRR